MKKSFAMAEVKSAESDNPNGEFEVILSRDTVDRDGEIIDAKAFEPLPESIPFHAFHDFHDPIGRAVPVYEDGVLKARGVFASTARAQEIRTLVAEGIIGHTSVGFMGATRAKKDGEDAPHITQGELLEGSFVSVPSNRDAAVLMAKGYEADAKAASHRLSRPAPSLVRKAHGMTANALSDALSRAVREAYGDDDTDAWVRDYDDAWVVFELYGSDTYSTQRQDYTVTDGVVALSGDAIDVVARITYEPATPAPATPASQEAGKSPASTVVEAARQMARASLLSVD